MPNILIHEAVGYKIAKENPQLDVPNFYLGLIVPDAVNTYGFASKEKRWKAHKRSSNLEEWKQNILGFYNNNKNKIDNNYLIGYIVHVLTDIICDEIYNEKIREDINRLGKYKEENYQFFKSELIKYEYSQIKENWWKYTISKLLEGEIIEINELEEKLIKDWTNTVIDRYKEVKYSESGYIKESFINELSNKVEEILKINKIGR